MARRVTNGLDLQNQTIINLADPSTATGAATKQYVDLFVRGMSFKNSVRAASTANITLTAPGTTLDGVALNTGDRILLKNQTTGSQNGIYVFNGSAATLTRPNDYLTGSTQSAGTVVTVVLGTVNKDQEWLIASDGSVIVDTTTTVWAQLSSGGLTYAAGNGLSLTGSTFAVVPGAGVLADATSTRVDFSVVPRKASFSNTVGAAGTYLHSIGTRDVTVTVYDAATFDEVLADVNHVDVNNVSVTFGTSAAAGAFRIVVQG